MWKWLIAWVIFSIPISIGIGKFLKAGLGDKEDE